MTQHRVVVAIHVIYLELLKAHIIGQSLKKFILFSKQDIASLESEFLYWWVGVCKGKYLATANADQFGVVAAIYEFVVKSICGIHDMLKTNKGELIFGKADCMHWIADLVHHIAHLLIL